MNRGFVASLFAKKSNDDLRHVFPLDQNFMKAALTPSVKTFQLPGVAGGVTATAADQLPEDL